MQPFSFFFCWLFVGGGGGISGRVRALNLTVPLGSGRVGSDDLGYGPGSGFSFEPVQTSSSCSPHLEHLSIICRPFYLPREFSSIVVTAVYIPPQADTSLALSKLHDELSGYINKHPDVACIIAGDFNKANLKKVMPNFHQHISCPTRGLNTFTFTFSHLADAFIQSDLQLGST